MASPGNFLSEDELRCSICLDVFTDPVSTPCGHNFCMICINTCWDTSSHCQCPLCKEELPQRPKIRVNTFISGLADRFRKPAQVQSSTTAEELTKSPVHCDFCSEKKQEAVKSCLICVASYCKTHLEPHERVSSFRRHKLIDPLMNLEDYICQKHKKPLEMFCKDDQMSVCLVCALHDHRNHNTVLLEEESLEKKAEFERTQVQLLIKERIKKMKEIKDSEKLNRKNTEKEKTKSMKIFRSLISSIERIQTEMMKVMEEKQKSAEHQAEEFIKELKQEITELKTRYTELEKICNTEDHLHLLQMYLRRPPPTNNWTDVRIQNHLDVEILQRDLSHLQKSVDELMKKMFRIELKRIQQYAVDVILDPDTANSYLILSDDGKQVTFGDTEQDLPDNPKRFEYYVGVLGKEGFSSGRFYYEVQVKGKTMWDLGVTRESSRRKGVGIIAKPQDGFWSVHLRNKNEYEAGESPAVSLPLHQAPQKLGVFVDYEEGLVSFYDVVKEFHIYTFTGQSFTEKLYPVFGPCVSDGDTNSAPLIITPVNQV